MIDTNVKNYIIKQKMQRFFFFHPKMDQDNIKIKIENSKINLRKISE